MEKYAIQNIVFDNKLNWKFKSKILSIEDRFLYIFEVSIEDEFSRNYFSFLWAIILCNTIFSENEIEQMFFYEILSDQFSIRNESLKKYGEIRVKNVDFVQAEYICYLNICDMWEKWYSNARLNSESNDASQFKESPVDPRSPKVPRCG